MAVKRRPGEKDEVCNRGKRRQAISRRRRRYARGGPNVKLEQVLLLADGENITVGTPLVKDSPVWTKVIEHFKGEKVTIFNYSPKKRIRVKTGHRQNYTRLMVEQIGGAELVTKEPVKKVEKAGKAKVEVEAPKAKAEKKVKAETAAVATKKPAVKTPAKTEKRPASKPAPAKKPASKPVKAAAKPAAKKTATKKPSTEKK
jgi:large subunit ribosomal protein L21